MDRTPLNTWNVAQVKRELDRAFDRNSELALLELLKKNSFLFQELVERQYSVQPIFHEISFGTFRCDFAWLNDRSEGPEWVLVEIEKPKINLFKANGKPTALLHGAIEQVRSWGQYFSEHPSEKKRLFGSVARFKYFIVGGSSESWGTDAARKWRIHFNSTNEILIRTSAIFERALIAYQNNPESFWSFCDNPTTLNPSLLKAYWTDYGYFDLWRKLY